MRFKAPIYFSSPQIHSCSVKYGALLSARRSSSLAQLDVQKNGQSTPKAKTPVTDYRPPTHPTSVPLKRLFGSRFPLSTRELIKDYALRNNPLKFQHDLLSLLPFYPDADPSSGKKAEVVQTHLHSGDCINEFVIYPQHLARNPDVRSKAYLECNHLIMIHGYGAGLGFFLENFHELLEFKNWIVHSIDLLGYGCSSRPKFTAEDLASVESFFHDSFQEWATARNLVHTPEKIMVLAHSMGAYLMATYALKHPDFCKKLMMVSPGAVMKHRHPVSVPAYFAKLWEKNISPFSLVRKAGPLGSKLVSMWSSRRFANLTPHKAKLLHKYSYGIFQRPGSGEYMLNHLLAPGADARFPLLERGVENLQCELLWCYGSHDWMDKQGGVRATALINQKHRQPRSRVCVIPNSGHHLYLDNPGEFNRLVREEMQAWTKIRK